jgi:hypothetical protein
MTELALSAKEVVLRLDRGVATSFKVDAPEEYEGTAELRIYGIGATVPPTPPTVILGALNADGDFDFAISSEQSLLLPRYGRYSMVRIDGSGELHAIAKGAFYCENFP